MQMVIFWIAIWGAVFSTVLGIIRIIEFLRDRANIQVKISSAIPVCGSTLGEQQLCLTAINRGRRKIKLEAAGLNLSSGSTIPHVSDSLGSRLPHELEERDNYSVFFDMSALKNKLKGQPNVYVTHAWFRDMVGNYYKRKLSSAMVKALRS